MKNSDKHTILVLDANQRASLAVVRSLGKHPGATILSADDKTNALAGSSKYSSDYKQYPSPQHKPKEFIDWLADFTLKHNIFAVLPITEVTSQLILMHYNRFKHCLIPFASFEQVMSIANKWQLVKLARKLHVPTPLSYYFSSAASFEFPPELSFPVIVKPCMSKIWLDKECLDTSVHIAKNEVELQTLLKTKDYLIDHEFMLQEFIPGHGAGVFCLYKQGQELAFFAHQRLREKPPSGGVSVLSQACEPDPMLKTYAQKLLGAANWHGVAMVEFRISTDGTPYLMEVNARFWGSLQLAIDSGVDFPLLLLKGLLLNESINPPSINPEQQLRWLLGDIDHLYLKLKSSNYTVLEKIKAILIFLAPPRRHRRHEINRLDDLMPAWQELKHYLNSK